MVRRHQHVLPHPQGWAVKKEWSSRATAVFKNQKEAIEYGRRLARRQGTELIIHNRRGEVRKRIDYGYAQSGTRKEEVANPFTELFGFNRIGTRTAYNYFESLKKGDDS
jgi:hypothetical protein